MKKNTLLFFALAFIFLMIPALSACDEDISNHTITIVSSNIQAGRVYGDGTYKTGEEVTLTATPEEELGFVAWIKNDVLISEDAVFTFTAGDDTEGKYTAIFTTQVASYYQTSGLAFNYKHVLSGEDYPEFNIDITGVTLKLTQLNSNNTQTVYDNQEISIEVLDTYQTTDTLEIESDYYLSLQKDYYLTATIFYTLNGTAGSFDETVVVDLNSATFHTDINANVFAQVPVVFENDILNAQILIALHGAGIEAPSSVVVWN